MDCDLFLLNNLEEFEYKDCTNKDPKHSPNQIESDFQLPDDELSKKILHQVEFFFSDSNVYRDKFLLKHIRRNKDGYVSLKLISSLRKVKALTKDWRVVAYSLDKSEKLEMNSEKTKIKRIDPLLQEVNTESKKVLLFKKSSVSLSDDDIKSILKEFGTVVDISILDDTQQTVLSSLKRLPFWCKNISSEGIAIVEFSNAEEATSAVHHIASIDCPFVMIPFMNDDFSERKKFISPKSSPKNGKIKKDSPRSNLSFEESRYYYEMAKSVTSSSQYSFNSKKSLRNWKCSTGNVISYDIQPSMSGAYKGDIKISWKERRQMGINHEKKNVIITRQPKGPDGTIGFHAGRIQASLKTLKLI